MLLQSGRNYVGSSGYRYGFNGKEKVDEIEGSGDIYDYGARMYDPRLGRWLACDPSSDKYPSHSPYTFVLNNPIFLVDPNGKDVKPTSRAAFKAILNTINAKDRKYVVWNKTTGFIEPINTPSDYPTEKNGNFDKLKFFVNAPDIKIEVNVTDKVVYFKTNKDDNNRVDNITLTMGSVTKGDNPSKEYELSTKEMTDLWGMAIPKGSNSKGVDTGDDISKVYINQNLSEKGQAEVISHEFYGHTWQEFVGGLVKPEHNYDKSDPKNVKDKNTDLRDDIQKSQHETQKNTQVTDQEVDKQTKE